MQYQISNFPANNSSNNNSSNNFDPSPNPKMAAWLQVLRLPNLSMMLMLQFLVYSYILEPWAHTVKIRLHLDFGHLLLMSVSTALIAGAGYVINDYYDQKIDAINHPKDCFIGHSISNKSAMRGYIAINAVAMLLIALLLGCYPTLFFLHLGCIATLYAYARWLKKIPLLGNLVVAGLCALVVVEVLLPDYLFNPNRLYPQDFYTPYYQGIALKFTIFAAVATFLREVAKDIEDLDGDLQGGRKTLAIVFGWQKTKYILAALCLVFSLVLFAFSWDNWLKASHFSAVYLAWGLSLPMFIIAIISARAKTPKYFGRISLILKVYFVFGMGWLFFFEI
jgi:4-hydroxybenzoate polyprenyltransferase